MTTRTLEYLPLASLKGAEKNPKRHADAELSASINRFGFAEPIVLDERTGRLVSGHGRVNALRARHEAGEEPPEGVELSLTDPKGPVWMVPVVRGWSSKDDREADAFLLAANQLTIAGGWDDSSLAEVLETLQIDGGLEGLGFSDEDLKRILDDAQPLPDGFPEFDESAANSVQMIECPHCHGKFPK